MTNVVQCPSCGVKNRLATSSLTWQPFCGKCGVALPEGLAKSALRSITRYKYFSILGFIVVGGWLASGHREKELHSWANEHAAVSAQQGATGLYTSQPSVAPLRIVTPTGDRKYFIKLVDANSGSVAETVFVYGGQSFKIDVPLGTFRIRYASGSTWYGEADMFGPETTYSEFDKVFEFTEQGDQVSGYTVEFVRQRGGNLPQRSMSAGQF